MISLPSISRRDVARYLLLPEILPRLKEFRLNIEFIAYLLAMIFVMTRLLPATHPYIMAHSVGSYGIRDVFGEAWRGLRIDFKHIDHVIVFGSMILGVCLFVSMVFILIFLLITQGAQAAQAPFSAASFTSFFVTPHPEKDIALEMLDRTFQLPNFFGSNLAPQSWDEVTAFGQGLHALFAFFSYGILTVAGLIIMYYVVALLLESAQSGTPFGKRFASFYAPIRLVLAILLLIPMGGFKDTGSSTVYVGSGFGLGQYAALSMAKWGSALATNAWILVNKETSGSPTGMISNSGELIARPNYPDLDDVLRYYTLVHSCRAIYKQKHNKDIQPYLIRFPQGGDSARAVIVNDSMSLDEAIRFVGLANDLQIVFGEQKDTYTDRPANVRSYCGAMRMTIAYYKNVKPNEINPVHKVKEIYFTMMKDMWKNGGLTAMGNDWASAYSNRTTPTDGIQEALAIHEDFKSKYTRLLDSAIDILKAQKTVEPINEELLQRGWGGAGIWFNDIAQTNGAIMSSVINTPQPISYPLLMEHTMLMKRITNPGDDTLSKFSPNFLANINITDIFSKAKLDDPAIDAEIARFLGRAYDRLQKNGLFANPGRNQEQNALTGYINLVFGTGGLFSLQDNQEVHPLAKMAALGRGILDRALMYFGGSVVMSGLSGLVGGALDDTMKTQFGAAFDSFAAGMTAFAMVGVTVGFVLYYVIPMLPFMYFFFSVGRWVKAVFEAMVCIPLWALAHLRIDGDGISGQAAANGYFIILELFLRPLLTLFGLMAAISIFSAQAIVLEELFGVLTNNVAGHEAIFDENGVRVPTGTPIDQFFYTIMYAVLLYIMALASFKLIDLIPNKVLRFMGSQASAFSDGQQFEAEQTIQLTGIGGYQIADDVAKAGQNAAKAAGEAAATPVNVAMPSILDSFKASMRGQGNGQ